MKWTILKNSVQNKQKCVFYLYPTLCMVFVSNKFQMKRSYKVILLKFCEASEDFKEMKD